MSDHREAIAEVFDQWWEETAEPTMYHDGVEYVASLDLADALLGSDVLAQIRAEARAEALREAAAMFRDEGADAWGGDASWLTTGTRVANLAADWLDDRAEGSA